MSSKLKNYRDREHAEAAETRAAAKLADQLRTFADIVEKSPGSSTDKLLEMAEVFSGIEDSVSRLIAIEARFNRLARAMDQESPES